MSVSALVAGPPADGGGLADPDRSYELDAQVGFILRQVQQRHATIFASAFGAEMTSLQWAAMAKLAEIGECSQNLLGRLIATDVATIKGVVERMSRRGMVQARPDPADRRRLLLRLTQVGRAAYRAAEARALAVSQETLAPLSPEDRTTFVELLGRLR